MTINLSVLTHWRDYLELCKPRVVALMLVTSIVGMFLATPGWVPIPILFFGTLGIGFGAGAAAVVNHIVDQRIDAIMRRTQSRPLPTGKVSTQQAGYFALILGLTSMAILIITINTLTSILTFITLIGYAVIYTAYLKHATPQNIVIGGAAGAAPPVLGWAAVTGTLDPHSLLLMLIIFVWTPPHFWALSIHRYEEYAKADIPMLPVTHGIPYTKWQIFLYTCLLTAATLLPFAVGMSGWIYLLAAVLLDLGFLGHAFCLLRSQDNTLAFKTFKYSIWYLFVLFIALLVDHYWRF